MIYCEPTRAVKRLSLYQAYCPNIKAVDAMKCFIANMTKKAPEDLKVLMHIAPTDIIRNYFFLEEEVERIIAALGKPSAPLELEIVDSSPLFAVRAARLGLLLFPKKEEKVAEDMVMKMLDNKWLEEFPTNLLCLRQNKLISLELAMIICEKLNRLDVISQVCYDTINVILYADNPEDINWEYSNRYPKREFAQKYYPDIDPTRAMQNLYQVIRRNTELHKLLRHIETDSHKPYWNKRQVLAILQFLGTPDNPKFSLNNTKPKTK